MKDVGYKSQKGYSSFKMRPDLDFSSSVGHMIPVLYDFLYPGDKVDVSFKLKTRTQPLDAAAYGEFKECIDTFFVPIDQLYHNFGNQIYGIYDFSSDFFNHLGSGSPTYLTNFPMISLTNLITSLDSFSQTSLLNPNHKIFPLTRTALPNYPNLAESLRLLEALGIPVLSLYGPQPTPAVTIDTTNSINFWNLLAYQKIWYDHYRLSDRIDNDATAYNVDSLYITQFASLTAAQQLDRLSRICSMKYVPYDDDFYTKNLVSPIMGSSGFGSYPTVALNLVNQWLSNISAINTVAPGANSYYPSTENTNPTSVSMQLSATASPTYSTVGNNINTSNIRTIFASEKLLEITRRAGKHYDAQTLAHFGVNVPTGIGGECSWIGHHEQDLVVGEVVATADTQISDSQGNLVTTPLGKIGGRAFSLGNSRDVRYTANCHGILMSIFYIKPIAKYKQYGLDRLNTLVNPADYMNPAMDGLGLQPLFGYQTNYIGNAVSHNRIIGWQYRYFESKDKPKRVIGSLAGSLDYWTFWKQAPDTNADNYYVRPFDCNNLFLLQWTGQVTKSGTGLEDIYNQIYDNDNFLHSLAIGYNKASKMSVTGMNTL